MSETTPLSSAGPPPSAADVPADTHHSGGGEHGRQRFPLYARILIAMFIGAVVGIVLNRGGYASDKVTEVIRLPADLIIRALRTLATPLVLFAILNAFVTTEIRGREGGRLFVLLITNTVAAIIIGLVVVNVLRPGRFVPRLGEEIRRGTQQLDPNKRLDPLDIPKNAVPNHLLEPITANDVFKLILPALAFGIAIRQFKNRQIREGKTDYAGLERGIGIGFGLLLTVLLWVIAVIPLAVFCVVAAVVGRQGPQALAEFLPFIVVVIIALLLQLAYYLLRIRFETRAGAFRVLGGVRDALTTAFSTASSTATMPITYGNLIDKVKLRPKSASLGALVGANFNNDGTALYEAVAALFIAQAIGRDLDFAHQILVVLTAIVASVGAAGIPEAGLVTMVLVLTAVGLPPAASLLLIPVDWFLDRCRTAINVMGDVTVATLLDARERREEPDPFPSDPP